MLVVLVLAVVVQTFAANLTNVYTAGLSLVNTAPRLGRLWATVLAATAAIVLSALPLLHRGGAALGHAPGERRRAADRRHPRRLPDPAAGTPRRRRAVRSGGPLSVPRGRERGSDRRGGLWHRRLLRGARGVGEGGLGRRRRCGRPISSSPACSDSGPHGRRGSPPDDVRARRADTPGAPSTRMRAMRAVRGRRALLGAVCAVVVAGVATAVVLVTTAHSSSEPTRAQYLAGVAASAGSSARSST